MQSKLFNKSSMERISSPEKLNDYIQVANPSIWLILGAAIVLLVLLSLILNFPSPKPLAMPQAAAFVMQHWI